MKKILGTIGLFSVLTMGVASASPVDLGGSITLRDGEQVVRISVGEENSQNRRKLAKRVKRLEKAVRALQNRVYELEDSSSSGREVTVHTCVLPDTFEGTFIGKGSTEVEARANAVNACKRGGGFPCRDRKISSCETSTEYVN